jgi:hypothetical protein
VRLTDALTPRPLTFEDLNHRLRRWAHDYDIREGEDAVTRHDRVHNRLRPLPENGLSGNYRDQLYPYIELVRFTRSLLDRYGISNAESYLPSLEPIFAVIRGESTSASTLPASAVEAAFSSLDPFVKHRDALLQPADLPALEEDDPENVWFRLRLRVNEILFDHCFRNIRQSLQPQRGPARHIGSVGLMTLLVCSTSAADFAADLQFFMLGGWPSARDFLNQKISAALEDEIAISRDELNAVGLPVLYLLTPDTSTFEADESELD